MIDFTNYEQNLLTITQTALSNEYEDRSQITPLAISQKLKEAVAFTPGNGNPRLEDIEEELLRRLSIWIGQDTVLLNNKDHEAWLDERRKDGWRYWPRYRQYLEKKLSETQVDAINRSTNKILGLLEDPQRSGGWDRRGLVVGNVQSGKTSNYTGLINKAADAGYKIIIVLAGMHNNLRSQTQMRLDEGFLGYETDPNTSNFRIIGVGDIDSDIQIRPNFATNRTEKGDFSTKVSNNLGISPEQKPWLFVIKKNKTILNRLYSWIEHHVAEGIDPERQTPLVSGFPLLLIDDEADNASVDTGGQIFDEQGNPDKEHQPKAINKGIRKILNAFLKSAYVGYTATPFANIFIHDKGETTADGLDLFPASFIINLATPSNYIGPIRIFGNSSTEGRSGGLPLIRLIPDNSPENTEGSENWLPKKHRNHHRPLYRDKFRIPESLEDAILSFVLACSIRVLRGQPHEHCSMLIHVTRFNSVQMFVSEQVENYLRDLRRRISRFIDANQILDRIQNIWECDFKVTNVEVKQTFNDYEYSMDYTWKDIIKQLPYTINDIEVRTINGTAKEALDYEEYKKRGLKIIAIGGDKLSRGLTLEGLCTSYFLRSSSMYDTLMQMGRWFGYRPGYIDLCRLYITDELMEWFCHITDASEELREELDMMALKGATPKEYGLKVQSHPVLLVTSRLKMRSAKDLWLSFSGELLETIVFRTDQHAIHTNLNITKSLMRHLGNPNVIDPEYNWNGSNTLRWQGFIWENVNAEMVIRYMEKYIDHPKSYKVKSRLIAEFISGMNNVNELTGWTIAVIGSTNRKDSDKEYSLTDDIKITMLDRSRKGLDTDDRYSIGRLMSPRDESIGLGKEQWKAAMKLTQMRWENNSEGKKQPEQPSGPSIREIKGFGGGGVQHSREKGLLLFYILNPKVAKIEGNTEPLVGWGVSFPGSNAGEKVLYKVNTVEWKQWEEEYGTAY